MKAIKSAIAVNIKQATLAFMLPQIINPPKIADNKTKVNSVLLAIR
jgi:hypothetical protein